MRWMLLLCAVLLAAPAFGQGPAARPEASRSAIDGLLESLRKAPSEAASAVIEGKLRQAWANAAGPSAAILLGRGMRNLGNEQEGEALDDFDAALTLEPNFTEGFARRATARLAAGDIRGALVDIQETLKREPRHFGALKVLSNLAEKRGDYEGALSAWEKVLEIAPRTPGAAERLIELRQKIDGEGT